MLLAAGLALPHLVWAHGYVQWEGAKMSKTAGTAVSLGSAIERHGTDALRYFLLREVGSRATAISRGTGSTRATQPTSRIRSAISCRAPCRWCSAIAAHRPQRCAARDTPLESAAREGCGIYAGHGRAGAPGGRRARHRAGLAREPLCRGDGAVETRQGERDAELDQVLASSFAPLRALAVLSAPFIPLKAETIWSALGAPRALRAVRLADVADLSVTGQRVSNPPPLFPKPVPA